MTIFSKKIPLSLLGLLLVIGFGAVALWASEKNSKATVVISKAEYEALKKDKEDAEKFRARNAKDGMATEVTTVFGIRVTPWKLLGYVAAFLFSGRWFVQMYYSRKAGRPVFPRIYWVISMVASVMLLSYWTFSPQRASVGVLQNLFPSFVAVYNLYLDIRFHKTNGLSPNNDK